MAKKPETNPITVDVLNEVLHGISQRLARLEGQLTPMSLPEHIPALVQNYYLESAPTLRGGPEFAMAHQQGFEHCKAKVIHRQHEDEAADQKTISINAGFINSTQKVQVWAGPPGQEGAGPPSDASTRIWNKEQENETRSLTVGPGKNIYMHYDKGDSHRRNSIGIEYEVT